jgi:hypothetical protein
MSATPATDQKPATSSQINVEELKKLIAEAQSMNESERKYWLDLLPMMSEEQKLNLLNILTTEKRKLEEIDKKYEKKMDTISTKYLSKWSGQKQKEHREKRHKKEQAHQKEAHEEADALLEGLE